MSRDDPRAAVRAFQRHRTATLRRLERVSAVLARWDGVDCAAEMPEDLRPQVRGLALCRVVKTWRAALWTFALVDGMEPTNNVTERALRPAVQ